ncbi:MAG: glycosyltransferase family 4 protein [Capsulimonadales bacterium]|nr:glycosyltransferase family 4 protein [Capsulimonadales bacterium]
MTEPLRVTALTSGRNMPSTRFRVRQHLPYLASQGVSVREYAPAIAKTAGIPLWPRTWSPKYVLPLYGLWQGMKLATRVPGLLASFRSGVVWLQREILPGYLTLEPLLARPIAFDIDDAIWMARPYGPRTVREIARRSAVVLAGNSYLADWLSDSARRVRILPTAIDTDRFHPVSGPKADGATFVVGWTGIAANYPYLYAIETGLRRFLDRCSVAELRIVAEEPPRFREIAPERVRFVRWTPENEASVLREMDVGLMPLPDTEWTRGKCSFKMLQYMATGLPVLASPVGLNADIHRMGEVGFAPTTDEEWTDALDTLFASEELRRRMGKVGRRITVERFGIPVIGARIADALREAAE